METKNINITMIRENLDDIPQFALCEPFAIRRYEPGDENVWTDIHLKADRYNTITPDLFAKQFGSDVQVLRERQCYLCKADARAIGTASAWFDDNYNGQRSGRVHWVAIVPEMQGKGLSKPLLAAVCNRLKELGHERACLGTSTARIPAVSLYLKFGFVPEIKDNNDVKAWKDVEEKLGKKLI